MGVSLSAGQRLGPYEIVALLGSGGMGEVYRARDPRLERTVAIKVLPPQLAQSETYRQRFQREARAASALSHPNIAQVYDVGEQDGTHFIAMEHVEGENLRALVTHGPLEPDRVAELGVQMASALEEAHSRGIVHRDIKSANVVVSANGQVKVLDFGLARQTREGDALLDSGLSTEAHTQEGTVMGTVPYMSPEQALGKPVDARTERQINRVDSVRIAAMRAERFGLPLKGSALASDAFFPFRDNVDEAAKYGVTAIIEPGGSIKDDESIAAANEHGIAMAFTGIRHFKHRTT